MFEEYAAKTIGIDFGTNNSVVGVYNTKIEKPLVIENEEACSSVFGPCCLVFGWRTR